MSVVLAPRVDRSRRLLVQWGGYWRLERKLMRSALGPQLCTALLQPALYLVAFTLGFGRTTDYVLFLSTGLVGMSVIHATAYILMYRFWVRLAVQKSVSAVLATAVSPVRLVVFQVTWSALIGTLLSCPPLVLVAALAGGPIPGYVLVVALIALATVLYSALGLLVAVSVRSIDSINYVATLVFSPMFLLGGVFFPVDELPRPVAVLNMINPVCHLLAGIRGALSGEIAAQLPELAFLAVGAAGATAAAAVTLTIRRRE